MTVRGDMPCWVKDDNGNWIDKHSDPKKTKITLENLAGFDDYQSEYAYDKLIEFV
jgi:hypothetical protein